MDRGSSPTRCPPLDHTGRAVKAKVLWAQGKLLLAWIPQQDPLLPDRGSFQTVPGLSLRSSWKDWSSVGSTRHPAGFGGS